MLIICPNCQTNYQVAQKAIGALGRKVVCANCQQPWQAKLELAKEPISKPKIVANNDVSPSNKQQNSDEIFSSVDEKNLDDEFSKQEQIEKQITIQKEKPEKKPANNEIGNNKFDKSLKKQQKKALLERKDNMMQNMPLRRMKQGARIWVLILLLLISVGSLSFRNNIVDVFPQFAKFYEAAGLKVNLVGLEFINVKTLITKDNSRDKLSISANIHNVTNNEIAVPDIIISLFDENEEVLMQWSVAPRVKSLRTREILDFETHLEDVPFGTQTVKFSFARN
ncbi:MAG: zinc-ribbon domain-containing protein [Devosiaceae bacterium]|nr:zinc-ribbon domain-containing protein [Devosiaceae bacterium]